MDFKTAGLTFLILLTLAPDSVSAKKRKRPMIKVARVSQIAQMIKKVERSMEHERALKLAHAIRLQALKHQLDPKIIIAIIDTESDFRHESISSTGDLSLAQINPDVWCKEFIRLGKGELDIERLKEDEAYAIDRMAEILRIIKNRHAKKDPYWYARYHSTTKKFKLAYKGKLRRKLASIQAPEKIKKSRPKLKYLARFP